MQFLPKGIAVLAALLLAAPTLAFAQSDVDKKKSSKGEATSSMSKGSDAMTKPASPDVTGRQGTNSPSANRTPADGGPGVNPNVEDKSPGAKKASNDKAARKSTAIDRRGQSDQPRTDDKKK